MDKYLAQKIKTENIEVHRKEALLYDILHLEIFNFYEQKRTLNDINFIGKLIISKVNPRALDIGCGTGNLTLKLLERGFNVTGIDITKEMIEVLRSKNQYGSLKLIECDADTFISKETEKYDVIAFSSIRFSTIDGLLFYFILKLRGIKIPKISYIYSDYHAQKGLDIEGIVECLIHEGCEILKFEKYNIRKFGIHQLFQPKKS